jgi:hypothetical protein
VLEAETETVLTVVQVLLAYTWILNILDAPDVAVASIRVILPAGSTAPVLVTVVIGGFVGDTPPKTL